LAHARALNAGSALGIATGLAVGLGLWPGLAAPARADTHVGVRLGQSQLDLSANRDTPLFGGLFDEALTTYNAGASAYNDAHGLEPGDMGSARPLGEGDFDIHDSLLVVVPSLEVGSRGYFFRMEAPLGFGDSVNSYGLGLYPLNYGHPLSNGQVMPYISAGGVLSYLTHDSGASGVLTEARIALGVRFGTRVDLEIGYGAFVLGGVVDTDRLSEMDDYDPRTGPPPVPNEVLRGGAQQGRLDLSFGLRL
jgi:hypothetical protein